MPSRCDGRTSRKSLNPLQRDFERYFLAGFIARYQYEVVAKQRHNGDAAEVAGIVYDSEVKLAGIELVQQAAAKASTSGA